MLFPSVRGYRIPVSGYPLISITSTFYLPYCPLSTHSCAALLPLLLSLEQTIMLHRQQHISTISIIMTCLLSLMSSSIFPRSCGRHHRLSTDMVMAYTTFVPSTASRCALLSKGSYYKSTSISCRRNISSTSSFAMLKSSRSNLVMWGEEDALNKQSRPGK